MLWDQTFIPNILWIFGLGMGIARIPYPIPKYQIFMGIIPLPITKIPNYSLGIQIKFFYYLPEIIFYGIPGKSTHSEITCNYMVK